MATGARKVERPRTALAVVSLVLFLTFLDNTIVSVALADVQTRLHAGVTALQWVIGGYALSFAALMLPFGLLGDQVGRRRVMAGGVALFAAGSLLGALAPSAGVLIAARVIMGVGAAASEPGTLSMVRHLFPDPAERATALGAWVAVTGLALAAGPVLGELLVAVWSFRGVFVANVVLAAAAMAGIYRWLPENADPTGGRPKTASLVLGPAALAMATGAAVDGESAGYGHWLVVALFAGAAAAGALFVLGERGAAEPILDLQQFRQRAVGGANAMAVAASFATFGLFFCVPLYLAEVGTASGYTLAGDFALLTVAMTLTSGLTGRWVARRGPRLPAVVGSVVAAIGIVATEINLTPQAGVTRIGWTLALAGAGLGTVFVPVTSVAIAAAPGRRSGRAASTINTSRELGALAGVAVLGAIINGQLTVSLTRRLTALHIPPAIRSMVVTGVTTGQTSAGYGSDPRLQALIATVERPAYAAFRHGLDLSLGVGVAFLLVAALGVAFTFPGSGRPSAVSGPAQ
ncbi:MFS transporter [Acidiferrimicrobium sp. IK]|uniref:MFS transporter n=1 Tax=Acidiferrimicrobium sp. IK TaxID=2871700 RepID=UPI0021CB5B12|nr:MFS transporter [Acidiferrimicrobium sp. IK]MCU4182919.1 MFS transporter [Acidiferrimicrobium sp. IK]